MKLIEKDTPGQQIADLCKDYGISQKELAEKIGLSAPQLSRIISGKTSTINSDALIGIAETFKVSTDYILGLSSISVRKSYDISQLGLSENAIKGLVTETIDAEILNHLLENPKFSRLLNLIRIYFEDSVSLGMMSRNDMINMATMSLSEIMQQNPAQKTEAKHDIRLLNAQKFGEHEAEIERMKNIFVSILRDIKRDIDPHIEWFQGAVLDEKKEIVSSRFFLNTTHFSEYDQQLQDLLLSDYSNLYKELTKIVPRRTLNMSDVQVKQRMDEMTVQLLYEGYRLVF